MVVVRISAKSVANAIIIITAATAHINAIFSRLQFRLAAAAAGGSGRSSGTGATAYRRELTALLTPGRHRQNLPTRRARGVGPKPRVDARHVEAVAALRQHADLVAVGELRQADRALRRRHPLLRRAVDVGEFRKRLENLLFEAFVRQSPRRRTAGAGATAEPGAASDGDETDDAY